MKNQKMPPWLTANQVAKWFGYQPKYLLGKRYMRVRKIKIDSVWRWFAQDIINLGYPVSRPCCYSGCHDHGLPGQPWGFSFCEFHQRNFEQQIPVSKTNTRVKGSIYALLRCVFTDEKDRKNVR